jgi:hypothetical protein
MADSTALYMDWKTGSRLSRMLPLTYSAALSCSRGTISRLLMGPQTSSLGFYALHAGACLDSSIM